MSCNGVEDVSSASNRCCWSQIRKLKVIEFRPLSAWSGVWPPAYSAHTRSDAWSSLFVDRRSNSTASAGTVSTRPALPGCSWRTEKSTPSTNLYQTTSIVHTNLTFLFAWTDPGGNWLLMLFCSSSCVTVRMAASRSRCNRSSWWLCTSRASPMHFFSSCIAFDTCEQSAFIFSNGRFDSAITGNESDSDAFD